MYDAIFSCANAPDHHHMAQLVYRCDFALFRDQKFLRVHTLPSCSAWECMETNFHAQMLLIIIIWLLIFKRIAHALFDTSASRSFIFATYIKLFELVVGMLDESIYVST